MFRRSGTSWAQQGLKLTGRDEPAYGDFGIAVALSGDGTTALVGSYAPSAGRGAAWVFERRGDRWTQQGGALHPRGEAGSAEFGGTVALSADGDTALLGGAADNKDRGAAWVFVRHRGVWTQQGEKLTAGGETGAGAFGLCVGLSASGGIALIGGWTDSGSVGAAWVFTRSGVTWEQEGNKLTGRGETARGAFGSAVALSADARTTLIAGIDDSHHRGAVWTFRRPR